MVVESHVVGRSMLWSEYCGQQSMVCLRVSCVPPTRQGEGYQYKGSVMQEVLLEPGELVVELHEVVVVVVAAVVVVGIVK